MIQITDKKNCCGCGACSQICPTSCIRMEADGEGFLYPTVDTVRCVDCGACERVCPILHGGNPPADSRAYAAICKDEEVRRTSSSGGIFSLLAEQVLADGGVVFGAAYDEEFAVRHIMIDRKEDLPLVKGSKYLQSRMEDAYKQAESVLKTGRTVLFSGTGCQIAGLKNYLKIEYNNLYAVDVFCHGVPSPNVWRNYLETQKETYQSEICHIDFRYKVPNWRSYSMRICFADGGEYCVDHGEDAYFTLFLSEICLRPACYDCKFRESRSGADLTLGDAWGVERWMPQMDDNRGTSIVVVNTGKGKLLWEMLQGRMCSEEGNKKDMFVRNPAYLRSMKPHFNRKNFFSALSSGASLDALVEMTHIPLWRKGLAFGKRCVNKLLKLCGFRICK